MSTIVEEYYWNAQLSMAAYAEGLSRSNSIQDNIDILIGAEFTQSQAENLLGRLIDGVRS